jgi:hypothetical protein
VAEELLTPQDAAQRLDLAVTTLYDWLGRSKAGLFILGGERVSIRCYQTGPQRQGRIRIPAGEIDRLLELMRVVTKAPPRRRPHVHPKALPGIVVALGRPELQG